MKKLLILTLILLNAACAGAWVPDILGDGYEMRHVRQPDDYSGAVRSTIIRKLSPHAHGRGLLYIHGFNDYFFQSEMGDMFVSHGYDFYAVDLRKYGRSLMEGQRKFEARSLKEYFPDIDSAIVEMRRSGIREIVLMGHSTGGLISAYYLSLNPQPDIVALLLNSPFLDWNLGKKEWLIPAVTLWGKFFPSTSISQGESTAYAESLLAGHHGQWHYDTDWKLTRSPDVTAGWVRAITLAQRALRDGRHPIRIPILLMYSGHSVHGDSWNEAFNHGDAVLDVNDIRRYGRMLGPHVTFARVDGGLHDLMLSRPSVRRPLYRYIFEWLGLIPALGIHSARAA